MTKMNQPWMIWYAIILNGYWGITTLLSDVSAKGYALYHLRQLLPEHLLLGGVLVSVAALAFTGLFLQNRLVSLVCLLPQQATLVIAAVGGIDLVLKSNFANQISLGTHSPHLQVAGVMVISLVAAILHTLAIIDHTRNGFSFDIYYWWRLWKHGQSH